MEKNRKLKVELSFGYVSYVTLIWSINKIQKLLSKCNFDRENDGIDIRF